MPDGPVVANNTPLAALWAIGRLDLLKLFRPVIMELRDAGLYLAPSLIAKVLGLAGEA